VALATARRAGRRSGRDAIHQLHVEGADAPDDPFTEPSRQRFLQSAGGGVTVSIETKHCHRPRRPDIRRATDVGYQPNLSDNVGRAQQSQRQLTTAGQAATDLSRAVEQPECAIRRLALPNQQAAR